jgi:hypothetical protein
MAGVALFPVRTTTLVAVKDVVCWLALPSMARRRFLAADVQQLPRPRSQRGLDSSTERHREQGSRDAVVPGRRSASHGGDGGCWSWPVNSTARVMAASAGRRPAPGWRRCWLGKLPTGGAGAAPVSGREKGDREFLFYVEREMGSMTLVSSGERWIGKRGTKPRSDV